MNPLEGVKDVAELVTALSEAEKAVAGSIHTIAAWVNGGEPPAVLPPLPPLVKGDLEFAAMKARAGKAP